MFCISYCAKPQAGLKSGLAPGFSGFNIGNWCFDQRQTCRILDFFCGFGPLVFITNLKYSMKLLWSGGNGEKLLSGNRPSDVPTWTVELSKKGKELEDNQDWRRSFLFNELVTNVNGRPKEIHGMRGVWSILHFYELTYGHCWFFQIKKCSISQMWNRCRFNCF